ncbi:MAG: signal peptidase I [Oribacterium sp.]|nr:signal peptidase I [Oribacterium sp.]MDY6316861.1 signal peptidase I [Oribacterium sp.]
MREHNPLQQFVHAMTDIIVLISLAWFIVHSFLSTEIISGHSMEPSLSAGDLVMVDTLRYQFVKPKRFDIVEFRRSGHDDNVKRVVALPGETIVIQNNRIYIDGRLLENDFLPDVSLAGIAANPVQLGANEYFLIGDNADSSEDSRFSNVGNVRLEQIIGRVWFRLKPFNKFGPTK